MKALKYFGTWDVEIADAPDLKCSAGDDIILDIAVCGICGTDVGIISGTYPVASIGTTLGHETCGIVTSIGDDVTLFKLGDRVVVNPTYFCGHCRMCKTGNQNHCEMKLGTEAGVSSDGAFAGQYRAKEAFLHKLDDHVSMQAASLTEPLSCAITGIDKLAIMNNNIRAAVIGAGPMGMLYFWLLRNKGINVFIVEKNPQRFSFSLKRSPANVKIYNEFENALEQEYGSTNNQIDVVVDTTGILTESILPHLSPGGKLLNVGLKEKNVTLNVMNIADKSLSIIGSIDSLNNSFERAYEMIRDKIVPVDLIISHEIDFDSYQDAFRLAGCDLIKNEIVPIDVESCKVLIRIGAFN